MDNFYMKYVELRDGKGLTDGAVAKATGISSGSFDAWKKGEYGISMKNAVKLAKFFKVSINKFI